MAKKLSIADILSNPTDIARLLNDDVLQGIFDYCDIRYKDLVSIRTARNEKLRQANEEALQVFKPKTFPWKGAASVKYPLITNACIDFASRIFPAVWQDGDVVKTKFYSDQKDYAAGDRIARYLNFVLAEKVPAWPDNLDKLTTALPINGLMLKKVYFDEISTIQLVKSKHVRRAFKNRNSLYHITGTVFLWRRNQRRRTARPRRRPKVPSRRTVCVPQTTHPVRRQLQMQDMFSRCLNCTKIQPAHAH